MNLRDIDILARTLYGEARGEYAHGEGGIASLIAVGNVVMNRLKARSWYGTTIQEICQKPWQFSCWNERDPNRDILIHGKIVDPVFCVCQHVATKVAGEEWPDLTKGSDHYHAVTVPQLPLWAKGKIPKVRIARHVFYQLNKGE